MELYWNIRAEMGQIKSRTIISMQKSVFCMSLELNQWSMMAKQYGPLTCSFDMGWQKYAAGRIYNSPSGHAFLVGTLTGKIICHTVYCKEGCRSCEKKWKKNGISKVVATKDEQPGKLPFIEKDHCCPRNYNGTSKSMEARSAL